MYKPKTSAEIIRRPCSNFWEFAKTSASAQIIRHPCSNFLESAFSNQAQTSRISTLNPEPTFHQPGTQALFGGYSMFQHRFGRFGSKSFLQMSRPSSMRITGKKGPVLAGPGLARSATRDSNAAFSAVCYGFLRRDHTTLPKKDYDGVSK